MLPPRIHLVTFAAGVVAWSTVATVATAQAEEPAAVIANNEGLFIDAQSFTLTQRLSKDDVGPQISRLGARQLGPGVIIFRSGDKLYIVDYSDARARMMLSGLASAPARETVGLGADRATASRLRDDEINRQAVGSRLRDDEIARQALGSRLRDDGTETRRQEALGVRVRSLAALVDPGYAYFRMKQTFDTVWSPAETK